VTFLVRILLLLLAAAGIARAQQAPIVVGAAVSQSGVLAALASDYRKGLLLWEEQVNAAGGLLGRRVELRVRDDGSDAVRAGALYAELIGEDKADLLVGPYGSAATMMAAAEAERARRVLINGAGPSRAVHKRTARYLFQTGIPNNSYGAGVLELARDAGLTTVFILTRDDAASREMAEAARDAAARQGLKTPEIEIYGAAVSDFAPQVQKALAAGAEAWIAFGELRDAADMVRTFKKLGYAPRLFFARKASDSRFIDLVGQDAEFSLATKEYDPRFATPGNRSFAAAFAAKWKAPPGPAAAEGYAAAAVLAEAVRRAGSLDQEKLRAMLAQLETDTVLGPYKVDPASGAQIAAKPAVVQIHRGKIEVVWPQPLQTAKPEPNAPWGERRVLK
jgi:branched-chain amino acid transport system substrate-binding protein